ncbi:MAG TPA: ABC transporter substrate-binding protein [Bradyrhizobium sp.]|jgi:putative ABC transport system substrate-binding protein|nr:ABC transporter substrate-binding protein [Bradyrhizobium sp.]
MRRREFIALLGSAAIGAPRLARAQESAKPMHLALVGPQGIVPESNPFGKMLLGALAQLGYVRGQNLVFETSAEDAPRNLSPEQFVAQAKARNVDVIVVWGFPIVVAAKASGIPTVVAFGVGDPVATGLVKSLTQPGGNLTGISDVATELSTKRLGLLKELLPRLKRVAMLWNKDDLGMTLRYEASAQSAREIGADVEAVGVREPDDFNDAFTVMDREKPDAILMVSDSLTMLNRERVFDYAAKHRLPAIYEFDSIVREGGLMSYGADLKESFERTAAMADRIFKGAKPGDLPFERPTRYLFVINLKTAKSIDLEFPPTLLALADEVIE